MMLVCIQIYKHLFMLVRYLYGYASAARMPVCISVSNCEVTCVCSRKETSDTSIMIENGGIREGPLFPQREGENESHAEKHGW